MEGILMDIDGLYVRILVVIDVRILMDIDGY